MALISTQRAALLAAIDAVVGLNVYDTPRDRIGTPAAIIIYPDPITPATFGPGAWEWYWRIRLLITRTDLDSAIDLLDPYLSSTGTKSVAAAIHGIGNTYEVVEIADIGEYEHSGANYLGADIIVKVITND